MVWGLVPSFTRPDAKPEFFRMFNARSESIYERASFSRLMTSRRCIAFVDGYFEWKSDIGSKQPHFVAPADGVPMRLACIYDTWHADGAVEPMYTFSVLTRDADASIAWLHDRQPVFLQSDDAAAVWLDSTSSRTDLHALFDAAPPELRVHAVSKKMSSMGFQGKECVQPVKATTQTALSFEKKPPSTSASLALSSPMKSKAEASLSSPVQSPAKVRAVPGARSPDSHGALKRKASSITSYFSSIPSPSKRA
jgi:putative SOS response-associated peptidase YedK